MRPPGKRQSATLLTRGLVLTALGISQALWLMGCSLPERPTSPTSRYGQVAVTVQTNAGDSEGTQWPLLVIRSILTGEEHFLRQQKAATTDSIHYVSRVPPGRYRLLGLVSDPTTRAKKIAFTKTLGTFDVLANKQCQLGSLLHWQHSRKTLTSSLRSPTPELCWNAGEDDRLRARNFAERRQTLAPPANLGTGPVLRHSGLVSYRSSRNQAWQAIDTGAVNITTAVELNPNELLIGGEQGLLLYRKNNKQQRLPLKPIDSVVLALTATNSGVAMLISTKNLLQLLHSKDIHTTPWQVIATSDNGYRSIAAKQVRWTVTSNLFVANTLEGKTLLSAELP